MPPASIWALSCASAVSYRVEVTSGPLALSSTTAFRRASLAPMAPSQLVPTTQRKRVLPSTNHRSVSISTLCASPVSGSTYSWGDLSIG